MGTGQTVSYKGTCTVHTDRDAKDWFHREFSDHIRPNDESAAPAFEKFLDSPARVVVEFEPDYNLSFDSELMWARSPEAGKRS